MPRKILIFNRAFFFTACILFFVNEDCYAIDIRYKIRITTTNAALAFRTLSDQTKTHLIFPFDVVEKVKTKRIIGRFTLKAALAHLLSGTKLTCIKSASGVIVIRERNTTSSNNKTRKECFSSEKTTDINVINEPPQDNDSGYHLLDEIVTTALKREADLQDTPISVSTIPGEILEMISSPELSRVAAIVPNISFSSAGPVSGSSSVAVVYIRGIGQSDYTPVTDPGVGIYVDGVYYGRTVGSALDLMDIKSIEVVRGPQGTLFGRNTIGGAIAINTNDPKDELGGKIRLTGGSYNRNELFLTLHLPISENIKTSFNIMRRKRDGYVKRTSLPEAKALGNDNVTSARFKMMWRVNDRLSLKLTTDFLREREESAPEVNLFIRDDRAIPRAWNAGLGISTAKGCVEGRVDVGVNCFNARLNTGPFETRETSLSRNDVDAMGVSLSAHYFLSDSITSKLILSYRGIKAQFARQVDGTELNLFENREFYKQNQLSSDFRLEGTETLLDWTAGFFIFKENSNNQLDFGGVLNGILWPSHYGGLTENSNFALYGEAVFHISNRLRFTAGLRFTAETKAASPNVFTYINGDINNPPKAGDPGTQYLIEPGKRINSFSKITWRSILAYDLSDETSFYASVATGFKSGGFEWRITTDFTDKDLPEFTPENVTTYEIGLKSYFRETGLRLNISGFFSSYSDIQVATNLPGSIATQQQNAAKADIRGFEAEAIWQFNDAVLFGASVGHINASYKAFDPLSSPTLTLSDKFVLTPSWTLGWGGSVRIWETSIGSLSLQVDGSYKSSYQLEAANSNFVFEDGYTALNASLYYKSKDNNWSISFGVNNLGNETYIIGGDANSTIGYENAIFARPRNWYLTFEYEW